MAKKRGRKWKQKHSKSKKKKTSPDDDRWYYDACTLDLNTETYKEIIDGSQSRTSIVSHLSLGEAFGNCHSKGEKKLESFQELITKLKVFIKIVNNDGTEKILDDIMEEFPRLSITDALHLATAIKCKCRMFRTTDPDFNLPVDKVKQLGERHGIENFKIKIMSL